MQNKSKVSKVIIMFLLISIVVFCMVGCAEEQKDDLKSFSLESQEDLSAEESIENAEVEEEITISETIYVYVCGAVETPGVYELKADARVYNAIACAGGLKEDADPDYINQAKLLSDGEQIYIPTQEEVAQGGISEQIAKSSGDTEGKIDINIATKEELMTLNGIGESRAENILRYRQEQGGFQCIEDLMNVEGIKEGIFQKIKDSITVNTGS